MDGFSYTNIFETKGIEYLGILAFFALLIPFWLILNKQSKNKKRNLNLRGTLSATSLRIPQGLFFSRNHTWAHMERSGVAKVGLDDLLIRLTGEFKVTCHARPGAIIRKGDLLAVIGQGEKQLSIFSPVSGEVQTGNDVVCEQPELLTEDPFRKGWIYKIKPSDWVDETRSYFLAEAATGWMTKELSRIKDFIAAGAGNGRMANTGVILQDGGELRDHVLAELPDQVWQDFQKDFLNEV